MKRLERLLKDNYKLIVGELTLSKLSKEIERIGRSRIKVSGRSAASGKKKSMVICFKDLTRYL